MIDAHCHLDSPSLGACAEEVVRQAREVGVTDMVMAGTDADGWRRQSNLARSIEGIWPVYGLHPWWAARCSTAQAEQALSDLYSACSGGAHLPPVGVGETGLDTSHLAPAGGLEVQEMCFRAHIDLARTLDKPLVLHILKAHQQALAILAEVGVPPAGGMVHSFSSSAEIATQYQRLGLHISFSGSVTRSPKLARAAASVSAERLLIETDAPDQPPRGHHGEKNRPAWLGIVAESVANARGKSRGHIAELTALNASRLFGLPAGCGAVAGSSG